MTPEPRPFEIELSVNGARQRVTVEGRHTLADTVRNQLGLTGTNLGCEHGVCGACTVLLDGEPVRSCLLFACQVAGREVTTIEGVAGSDGGLHPVQEALSRHHGLQCGFCTPGVVLTAVELAGRAGASPGADGLSRDEIREELSGNLCRCTGYQGIVDAVESVVGRTGPAPGGG